MKKLMYLALALVLTLSLAACGEEKAKEDAPADNQESSQDNASEDNTSEDNASEDNASEDNASEDNASEDNAAEEDGDKVDAEAPGESGFVEIEIGEEQLVGPYKVAAVYFQAVDMIPAGKNPTKEESDMHLEADIHLQTEYAAQYGFGAGEDIWPAYLTVKYEVVAEDGTTVAEGSFMPMNADDGPHYGTNVKKDLMTVGHYTLKLTIEPPTDYLLHTDAETGVPAKEGAAEYFKTQTCEYEWDYTAEQLQNE